MGNPNLFGNRALIRQMYNLENERKLSEENAKLEEISGLKLFKVRIDADYSDIVEVYAQSENHAKQKARDNIYITQDDLDIDVYVIKSKVEG